MKKNLPIYYHDSYPYNLIPYSLFLSPHQLKTITNINSKGFRFTLNNQKLNSTPNIILNPHEDEIKKLEKPKRKGVGAQLEIDPSYFYYTSAVKRDINSFNEFLSNNNLTSKEYYEFLSKKRKKYTRRK